MSQQEIINLLSEMVKIPSISSDKDHRDDVDASAQFVENLFDKENKKLNINLEDEIIEKTLIK